MLRNSKENRKVVLNAGIHTNTIVYKSTKVFAKNSF